MYSFKEEKGKVHHITDHERPKGERFTLSLTSALDEGGWSTPRPGRFTPGNEIRYQLYRRLDGSQGHSGLVRKISPPPRFDLRTVCLCEFACVFGRDVYLLRQKSYCLHKYSREAALPYVH